MTFLPLWDTNLPTEGSIGFIYLDN